MKIRITLVWFLALLTYSTFLQAQLLQSFTFAGAAGTEITAPPNGQPTNGSLSHIKRGSGVTPNNAGNAFGATGFSTLATLDTADYFEFAIKANAGYQLRLDSVVVSERRSNTGIRKFVVRSSLDGFTQDLASFDLPDDNVYRNNQKTTLGTSFQQLSASTTAAFRFFGFLAENETGSWRLDSIRVYGNISTVSTGPTLSWNKVSESIPECLGQVQFQAVLSQAMNEDITFQVNASGNLSANELEPPANFSQLVTIPAGNTNVSFGFSSEDDALEEPNENLVLEISNPSGGVGIGQNGIFSLTVVDDDSPSQKYRFKQTEISGNEGTTVQIPIRLHASSKVPPGGLIKLAVKGGGAVGADYQTSQIGAIPLTSDSILQVQVQILQDGLPEPQGDSLILALRPSGTFGADFLGTDTVFVLKMLDNQTEPLPPTRTIAQVRGNNTNGGADSVGKKVRLYGTVYGLNQRLTSTGGGYQMYLRDATGGIGIFKTTTVSGITALNEGDSIKVMGTIEVFRGLSQINPDSMKVIATGRPIKTPLVANTINEGLESDLVRMNNVQLVNPSAWTTGVGTGGFTVKVYKGTDTTDVRIDNDCPLYNQPAPTGTFDIIGMGSQFVPGPLPLTPPYLGFFQLIPRKTADIIPASTGNTATISWEQNSITLMEGNEGFRAININPAAAEAGTYSIVNKSGNLTVLEDYSFTGNTPIAIGNTIKTIRFQALSDVLVEGTESSVFVLRSTSPSVVVGPDSLLTFTILDEDSPAQTGPPFTRTIAQVRGNNTNGGADSVGRNVRLYGTVYGLNQRLSSTGGGYQMYLRDATGGIGIFKTTAVSGITALNEGDSIKVMGTIEVFRGLSQINPDSMKVIATGRPIKTPVVANSINEGLESDLVRMNNVQLVNPSAWTTGVGTGGFTVKVYKGTDTTDVRIDNDCPLYNQPAPTGTFDIIGMGSQFVPGTLPLTPPYLGFFQLIPRKTADIIPVVVNNPVFSFSPASKTVAENSGAVQITVSTPVAPATDVVLSLAVKSGTATSGNDYQPLTINTLTFPGGVGTSQTFSLNVNDDAIQETTENVVLVIRKQTVSGEYTIGTDSLFTLNITDNDGPTQTGPPFTRTIAELRGANSGNQADSVGRNIRVFGTVYGVNQRLTSTGGGYQLFIRDATGGIGIFKNAPVSGVTSLSEGDSIKIMGKVEVFRGLSQINPDSLKILATGRPIKNPEIANTLNENLESDLVRINGVQLVNPANWTTGTGNGGFTVRVFKGSDTTDVRIDNDCPLYNQPAPTGTFDIIGMGSQFVPGTPPPVAPFPASGYQLIPRSVNDLIPTVSPGEKPVLRFTSTSLSFTESNTTKFAPIGLSSPPLNNTTIQVGMVVKGGTASFLSDYGSQGAITIFGPGSVLTNQLPVDFLDDVSPEPNETLILVLRKQGFPTDTGYTIGPDSVFTFTIIDNDNAVNGPPFTRTIAQVRGNNTNGAADSIGRNVRLFGTVYGLNQRLSATSGGYQMFIRDATGGIGIFKTLPIAGIPVLNEGDSIKVMGKIEVFRGLSQINPDSMVVLSSGINLKNPVVVPKLNESLEGDLVRLNNVQLVNPTAWTTGTGNGGFTVKVFNGLDTNDVRIDNDCPLYNEPAPTGAFDLIGMGSQFSSTTSAPFVGGYQLVPRRISDLIPVVSVDPVCQCLRDLKVFPNPAKDRIILETKEKSGYTYRVLNTLGQEFQVIPNADALEILDIQKLPAGLYFIKVDQTGKTYPWIKE